MIMKLSGSNDKEIALLNFQELTGQSNDGLKCSHR